MWETENVISGYKGEKAWIWTFSFSRDCSSILNSSSLLQDRSDWSTGALKGTKSAGLISDDIFFILPITSRIWFHLSTFLFFISSKYGTIALSSSRKPHPFCSEWRKDMMENTHYWWSPNRKRQAFKISSINNICVERTRNIIILKLCFTVKLVG